LSDRNKSASWRARTVLPRKERTDFTRRAYRLRQCEELLERPVKQRRFELEAALLLRDLMAISLAVVPPEER
jgi:hypothetical protein